MATYIPDELRGQIRVADHLRCAYCQTSEANSGIPLTFDHINPLARGGLTVFENLCLACRTCNEFKSDLTASIDPITGATVALFNPRAQAWPEHFAWNAEGTLIIGLTSTGRTSVAALRMNNLTIVSARRRWVAAGWHPPAAL